MLVIMLRVNHYSSSFIQMDPVSVWCVLYVVWWGNSNTQHTYLPTYLLNNLLNRLLRNLLNNLIA